MSIKQSGGVFGRNPTFNDVTIEGQLTFDGDIDINSDLKVDGNVTADGLTVATTGVTTAKIEGSQAKLQFFETDTVDQNFQIRLNGGDLITDQLTDAGANIKTVMRLDGPTGEAIFYDNIVIGTSGKGIDFSATSGTGTSEILSDYEQGTWTPTITGSTSGSVAGITINRAAYTKIGNQVTVYFYISAVNLDTASLVGNAEIGGLPFVAANSFMQLSAVNYTNFFSFDESDISVGSYVHSGTKVKLLKGSSTSGIPVGELSGTTQIMMFGMTYESS
tara:strand:+ start:43 stop:870 length:828 start_codon:yes stop_codon:yes gene_type:complete